MGKKNKKNKVSRSYVGTYIHNCRGFGFVKPDKDYNLKYDFFIPPDFNNGAIHGDIVLVEERAFKNNSYPTNGYNTEAVVTKIIKRNLQRFIALSYTVKIGRKFYSNIHPLDDRICANIHSDIEIDDGHLYLCEICDKYEDHIVTAKVVKDIGITKDIGSIVDAVLLENNVKKVFSDDVIFESLKVKHKKILKKNRLDLRKKKIITIDSESAKDLDDAVSVDKTKEGYTLGVHIADVSEYVEENSILDKEAFQRGNSIYYTNKVIPMLPEAISNDCCSLNSGTDKFCLSAIIDLDKTGNIKSIDIKESIINTSVRGIYSEINDVYEKGEKSDYYEKYSCVSELLENMTELYNVLKKKSKDKGALDIETEEPIIVLDDKGLPIDIRKSVRGISEDIIEQFMVCANEAVASWLLERDLPCVYRVHNKPLTEKYTELLKSVNNIIPDIYGNLNNTAPSYESYSRIIENAKKNNCSQIITKEILRSLEKAEYKSICSPHFGLGIDKYCHFTSPIRRYSDLAVHRIIKYKLHNKIDEKNLEKMTSFSDIAAKQATEKEKVSLLVERKITDIYKAYFMGNHIKETFKGIVTSVSKNCLYVEFENTCEGILQKNFLSENLFNSNPLGKTIDVYAESINYLKGKIHLELNHRYLEKSK